MKLINIWYTQFDISYRPRSKRTNWVLFYLICFSVINSPAEGIIPSRKREIKKREEKKKHQIYHSAQTVGRATVKHPCYYGIGNLVSWVWVETQTFFFFFSVRLVVFLLESGADTETGRQTQPVLWYCETPSASEGSGNFLSFFFSVEFLSSLMYLTRVWQRWLCAIGVEASCSLPRLRVFFFF